MITTRPARLDDLDALYRICLETGDGGDDATSLYEDPQLLGHVFVGPYTVLEPSLAFVAEDDLGVSGFVLGALDSKAFEEEAERSWWPELRSRYPDPSGDEPLTPDQKMMAELHHPFRTSPDLHEEYPSHLHINLLPRTQGQGIGGKLMSVLFDALRAAGSPGVHLSVWARNTRAIGFYRHIGFKELKAEPDGFTFGYRLN